MHITKNILIILFKYHRIRPFSVVSAWFIRMIGNFSRWLLLLFRLILFMFFYLNFSFLFSYRVDGDIFATGNPTKSIRLCGTWVCFHHHFCCSRAIYVLLFGIRYSAYFCKWIFIFIFNPSVSYSVIFSLLPMIIIFFLILNPSNALRIGQHIYTFVAYPSSWIISYYYVFALLFCQRWNDLSHSGNLCAESDSSIPRGRTLCVCLRSILVFTNAMINRMAQFWIRIEWRKIKWEWSCREIIILPFSTDERNRCFNLT